MLVAILGDLHRGYGYSKDQGSEDLGRKIEKSQDDFFDVQFIPYLREHNIKTVLATGDIYEQEYVIDSRTTSSTIDLFKYKLADFDVNTITGNHDIYYNNRRDVNSLKTIENLSNVKVWNEVSAADMGGRDILMCPWLVEGEHEKLEKYLSKKKPDIVFGHFDIKDMDMYRGRPSMQGFHHEVFTENVLLTLSGHYHTKSEFIGNKGKIVYVGTPYGLSHNDDGDIRGFWILNTDTLELTFIENTISKRFITISSIEEAQQYDSLENYFVRVISDSSKPPEEAALFRKAIDSRLPHHAKTKSSAIQTGMAINPDDIKHSDIVTKAVTGDDMVGIATNYINVLKLDEDLKADMISVLEEIKKEIRGKKDG